MRCPVLGVLAMPPRSSEVLSSALPCSKLAPHREFLPPTTFHGAGIFSDKVGRLRGSP